MRGLAGLAVVASLAGCGSLYRGEDEAVLTTDDVVAMKQAGVDDRVILAKIETSRVPGPLRAADIVSLKDRGLEGDVLEALVKASAQPPPVVHRPVYYGYPVHAYHPWYPYGYGPSWYGPRFSLGFRYGHYPRHWRSPYYRGYRTYRSRPPAYAR